MNEQKILKSRIEELRNEQTEIHKVMGPMQARLMAIYEELQPLEELRDQARVAQMTEPDWKSLIKDLASDATSSQALLRYFQKELHERFAMYHSGHWTDTNEADIKVMVRRGGNSAELNILGIKHFLPLLTPHENGRVWFGIFEHSLSAGGTLVLEALPDGSRFYLGVHRGYSERVKIEFETVELAVEYIRKNHWYGEDGEEYDDGDDEGRTS